VAEVLDDLFRRESSRLVAILTRRFGPENLHLAEDVVQDALVRAMETWPFTGVPENPTAWILHTACNRALDQKRRSKIWRGKQPMLLPLVEDCLDSALRSGALQFEDEIEDSQLRMMFVCCHPGLLPEAQVALTLKILCGFGEREIAAAFLTTEVAIAKRLGRARSLLRTQGISTEIPRTAELVQRLNAVRQALYLLFNEGYKASHGNFLLREDLCDAALRLGELLVSHAFANDAETHALLALMYFNAARMPARVDAAGVIFTMETQDRGRWDQKRMGFGARHLSLSGGALRVSRYHLEAGIAACHTLARCESETDWAQILGLYDMLLELDPSPVVALNRAVALSKVEGARAGLRALETMAGSFVLKNYHLLDVVAGHLHMGAGEQAQAAVRFRRAHSLATLGAERDLLARRIAEAEAHALS
jgi:RNA polymerase sigma factor (sigma-70 family)